jgi:hypothetical protein
MASWSRRCELAVTSTMSLSIPAAIAFTSVAVRDLYVLAADGATYRPAGRIPTATGARTSLFVPELDRLLLAVPTRGTSGAAIWIYRPQP